MNPHLSITTAVGKVGKGAKLSQAPKAAVPPSITGKMCSYGSPYSLARCSVFISPTVNREFSLHLKGKRSFPPKNSSLL